MSGSPRKRQKTLDSSKKEMVVPESSPSGTVLNRLPWDDLLPHVLSFVGDHQYRFIGTVNHAFHDAYVSVFPDCKKTHYNVSSIKMAEFCWNDLSEDSFAATRLCEIAAKRNFKVLKHLMKLASSTDTNGVWDRGESLCAAAAEAGHLHVLQWLRAQGCDWGELTSALAARSGHLKVLKWCHSQDCDFDCMTFSSAAGGGHLRVVKWLHEIGCPWDSSACSEAACEGKLTVLKWLRSKDCPWCPRTPAYAAMNGHLNVLKWVAKNDCFWDYDTCILAYEHKQWECFDFAIDNGFLLDEEYFEWDDVSESSEIWDNDFSYSKIVRKK